VVTRIRNLLRIIKITSYPDIGFSLNADKINISKTLTMSFRRFFRRNPSISRENIPFNPFTSLTGSGKTRLVEALG